MKIKITAPLYTAVIEITEPEINQKYQHREDQVYATLAIHLTSALAFLNAPDEAKLELLVLDRQCLDQKAEIVRSFRQRPNSFQPHSISPPTPAPTRPTIEITINEKPKGPLDPSKLN